TDPASVEPRLASYRRFASVISTTANAFFPSSNVMDSPTPQKTRRIELKYQVSHELARSLRDWAAIHMQPDEYAAHSPDCVYQITSLYLDTPEYDIYHRQSDRVRGKFRLRRYGTESTIWLERKRKSGNVVRKRRTAISQKEVEKLIDADEGRTTTATEKPEQWFRELIQQHQLQPVNIISYRRFAAVGQSDYGPVRFTIDDRIHSQPANGWHIPQGMAPTSDLLPGEQIVELKFMDVLPPLFRQLLMDYPISATGFSKYRTGVSHQLLPAASDQLP
ncbi:MAG: polyphosphate polymerase domain-containing protein, partial [Planctomycetaceae bacterium]|nr:polyphosphate polymerase domain-containing protein [Planctomycetaceae bacterium]